MTKMTAQKWLVLRKDCMAATQSDGQSYAESTVYDLRGRGRGRGRRHGNSKVQTNNISLSGLSDIEEPIMTSTGIPQSDGQSDAESTVYRTRGCGRGHGRGCGRGQGYSKVHDISDDLIPSLSTTASTKHSREMSYLDETLILSGSRTRCKKNSFVVLVQKEIKFISKTNSFTLKWLSEKALAFF